MTSRRGTSPLAALWRFSLVATLPVALGFVAWLSGFVGQFRDFRLRYDLSPYEFGFATEGVEHARHLLRRLAVDWTPGGPVDGLPILQLMLPGAAEDQLNSNLPHSGRAEVAGRLLAEHGWIDVDVRYRGDFWYHWAYPKKSLRVQVADKEPAFGMSTFHLIAPKLLPQVNDVAAYRLAARLGVLAPHAEAVQLRINGAERGVYLLVEHLSKPMLRAHGRIPAELWAGELVAADSWEGLDNRVFDHPGTWTSIVSKTEGPPGPRTALEDLCALLAAPPTDEVMAELERRIDFESFGRFLAAEALTQCLHNDTAHNWRFYYDSALQRIVPVLWDPNGWGSLTGRTDGAEVPVSLDPVPSRLQERLLTIPRILAIRARVLHDFLHGSACTDFLRELRTLVDDTARALPRDPDLRPSDPAQVLAALRALPATVERVFATIRTAEGSGGPVRWSAEHDQVRLAIRGRVPVTEVELEFETAATVPNLVLLVPRPDGMSRTLLQPQPLRAGSALAFRLALPAQFVPTPTTGPGGEPVSTRVAVEATYAIAAADGAPLPPLRAVRVAHADGRHATASRADSIALQAVHGLNGFGLDQRGATTEWRGTVDIAGERAVDGDLVLQPGTVLRMAPGARLAVHGRLLAIGTAAAPIRIERADANAAFGGVRVCGPDTEAQFAHCLVDGGGAATPSERFPAMLAVEGGGRARFDDCRFLGGAEGSAAVRVSYGDVRFLRCQFTGSRGDALQLAQTDAIVNDCAFTDIGRDGIALVGGSLIANATTLSSCAAHGVRIAERGTVLLTASTLRQCTTGLATTGGGEAALAGCTIEGGNRALAARLEDWHFGHGGRIQAWRCVLLGAQQPMPLDARSRILLGDCAISPPPPRSSAVELQGCDLGTSRVARLPPPPLDLPFPQHPQYAHGLWHQATQGQRGAP